MTVLMVLNITAASRWRLSRQGQTWKQGYHSGQLWQMKVFVNSDYFSLLSESLKTTMANKTDLK